MKPSMIASAACLSWLFIAPAAAHDLQQTAAKISSVLNFSTSGSGAADAFFKQLESNAGKVVQLTLEIIPNQQSDDLGYSLSPERDASQSGMIVCGDGNYGLIDNQNSGFELSFNHPENKHSPTKINIGDRRSFPFQTVYCGIEDYTSAAFTSLKVSGEFVVFFAEIPTANQIVLFPYAR